MKTKFFVLSSALALMSCSLLAATDNINPNLNKLQLNVSDTIPSDTIPKNDTIPQKDTTQHSSTATILKAKTSLNNTSNQAFNMIKESYVAISPAKEENNSEK